MNAPQPLPLHNTPGAYQEQTLFGDANANDGTSSDLFKYSPFPVSKI